jgi:SAM-dependent methyltransferase
MNWMKALALWETFWWARRRSMRQRMFRLARARANALGRQLVVVGAPDGGVTSGYGCGDITIDIAPSSCPNSLVADITKTLPFEADSVVVVVMCVLEYVSDAESALAELNRISGGNLFVVRVEPWTIASIAYPGARRTLSCEAESCAVKR